MNPTTVVEAYLKLVMGDLWEVTAALKESSAELYETGVAITSQSMAAEQNIKEFHEKMIADTHRRAAIIVDQELHRLREIMEGEAARLKKEILEGLLQEIEKRKGIPSGMAAKSSSAKKPMAAAARETPRKPAVHVTGTPKTEGLSILSPIYQKAKRLLGWG